MLPKQQPRKITSASIVIEGVKEGESPEGVVMWTILGNPLTHIAYPLQVRNHESGARSQESGARSQDGETILRMERPQTDGKGRLKLRKEENVRRRFLRNRQW